MSKVVVACFGDDASTAIIRQWAASAEVIAVAFDFGGPVSLNAMRDLALAAGAERCHALDVREEFAREVLVPASRSNLFVDPVAALPGLAAPFVAGKLQDIATAEQATCILPDRVPVVPRPVTRPVVDPLYLDIRFDQGMPVSINGVDMTLTELLESLETITGEPAWTVLQRAGSGTPANPADPQIP